MTIGELLKSLGISWDYSVLSLDTPIYIRRYRDDYSTSLFDSEIVKVTVGATPHTGSPVILLEEVEN